MYRKLVLGAMVEAKSKVHARMSFFPAMALQVGSGEYLVTGIELCHSEEAAEFSCQRRGVFRKLLLGPGQGWTL